MIYKSDVSNSALRISASLWSANIAELGSAIKAVDPYCDSYHFDIMDGHFVKELLFGADVVAALREYTRKPFEVHLMVRHPSDFIENFARAGADLIIFHPETVDSANEVIQSIRGHGCRVGAAVVSDMKIEDTSSWLPLVDMVLVMGTQIGIKGVSLLPQTFERIVMLRHILAELNSSAYIQADGGIRGDVIEQLYLAGADVITAGSLLFKGEYPQVHKLVKSFRR